MEPNKLETADLFTFTEENLDKKLHFLSSIEKVQLICLELNINIKIYSKEQSQ